MQKEKRKKNLLFFLCFSARSRFQNKIKRTTKKKPPPSQPDERVGQPLDVDEVVYALFTLAQCAWAPIKDVAVLFVVNEKEGKEKEKEKKVGH